MTVPEKTFLHDPEYLALPTAQQHRVEQLWDVMLEMRAAVAAHGSVNRAAAVAAVAHCGQPSCTQSSLRRLYTRWAGTQDWRALKNRTVAPDPAAPLELASDAARKLFLDFVGGFFQQNQRKARPGYRKFIRHWLTGGAVPGYGTWREYWAARGYSHLRVCPRALPAGWSYANLLKLACPPKVELVLARQGTSAALALLPPIPRSRDGLRPLEYVSFDDMDQDYKVMVPGYTVPVRLMQLASRDLATARWLRIGTRPQLPADADAARYQRLRGCDMRLLAAVTLLDFGYPRDYVSHWILEHGTATLSEADALALYQITGGRVVCCYSQMEGGLVLAFGEKAKGNSRAKAGHEADHNRWHNDAADLPGQVGKDRDHAPAALALMEREAGWLARVPQARLPFASLTDAIAATYRLQEQLNDRRDHKLEGFSRIIEWRLKGEADWRSQEELELWLQQIGKTLDQVTDLIDLHPHPRLETPNERWRRLSREVVFVKPPFAAVRRFLDDHAICKVESGRIELTLDGRRHQYWPPTEADALPNYEQSKTKYLGWYVPFAPDHLILTTEDGGYVATWRRVKIAAHDPEALAASIRPTAGSD